MTVVPTDYLKSHPATKQEAQLKNVEQSAYLYRHKFKHNKAKDLDWLYDNNRFIDLKYNRRSRKIIKQKHYIIWANLSMINELLLLSYEYRGSKEIEYNEFMSIVHNLVLVNKMPMVSFVERAVQP